MEDIVGLSYLLFITYFALQAGDGITTKLALSTPGLKEGDPVTGLIIKRLGTNGGIVAAKGLCAALGAGILLCGYPMAAAWALGVLDALYAGVVVHNILELKEH
jgi:hypothetical protein